MSDTPSKLWSADTSPIELQRVITSILLQNSLFQTLSSNATHFFLSFFFDLWISVGNQSMYHATRVSIVVNGGCFASCACSARLSSVRTRDFRAISCALSERLSPFLDSFRESSFNYLLWLVTLVMQEALASDKDNRGEVSLCPYRKDWPLNFVNSVLDKPISLSIPAMQFENFEHSLNVTNNLSTLLSDDCISRRISKQKYNFSCALKSFYLSTPVFRTSANQWILIQFPTLRVVNEHYRLREITMVKSRFLT